ncbi:hypothetical protein BDY21DRAFT_343895 [Lineolata rhizophorae]|uniref:Uncharacterized protein n=1 Tax=Lineolata rhizophorae TaxID=578093 RepID=A0A6A6P0B2_9PEZI|nr:hypothetical protein BDY21DRAFT_343895 [Lineolata rhizophorae]
MNVIRGPRRPARLTTQRGGGAGECGARAALPRWHHSLGGSPNARPPTPPAFCHHLLDRPAFDVPCRRLKGEYVRHHAAPPGISPVLQDRIRTLHQPRSAPPCKPARSRNSSPANKPPITAPARIGGSNPAILSR